MNATTSVIVRIDTENNAETFWDAYREALPALEASDPETFHLGRKLLKDGHVEINDAAAIRRFAEWVETLPGYSNGPEYAKDALIWQGVNAE